MKICLNLTASDDESFSGAHSQQVLLLDVPTDGRSDRALVADVVDSLTDIAIALFGPEIP